MLCWTGWKPERRLIWRHSWESMPQVWMANWFGGIAKFCDPPKSPLPTHNTQGGEWGFDALCGPKGALACHSEWLSLRCGTSGPWLYLVFTAGALLMSWDGQPDATTYQKLYTLSTAWRQPAQGPSTPHCGYCSPGSPTCWLHQHRDHLEPNQSPRVTYVLIFQDHFTKHMLAYVTLDQTAKTIAKFLYQGYISVFGAPARLLSDRGANFMSSVVEEMCKILGIKKLWTMPYHPQTNGMVDRSHQTIMRMIRKLGEDKTANWPSHLAEIAHTYNTTHSTVTGYSPHYLVFGQRSRLLVDFYFPTIGSSKAPMREASTKCVDEYIASVWDKLRTTLWEAQPQSIVEAHWQKWYYDRKIGAVNLKPGDLVLVKADAFKGKRKRIHGRWCIRSQQMSPLMKWWTNAEGHASSTKTSFLLHQRLVFPWVQVSIMHGTGVPAPPHTSPPPQEVKLRWHHKRILVVQSPNTLPARLPWGGSLGSYEFYCGHPLEHPQRMGKDHR